jgi:hypothetical protein
MIIAFSGKRGVGKTAGANYLINYGFTKVSFGEALKKKAMEFFPFTYQELYGNKKELQFSIYDWSPRDFMIALGNFARYFDKDYWIRAALPSGKTKKNIVIDDCRYLNEARLIKEQGGKIIRIERYKKDNPYKTEIHDPSEEELDDFKDFDFRVNEVENLTLTSLYHRLDHIMDDLGIKKS